MGRIRTVKPELFTHEGLYDLEVASGLPCRLAFIGIFTAADREGRFKWRGRTLKTSILPWDDLDFDRILEALHGAGFLEKYEMDGELFGVIPTWRKHQHINGREKESEIPDIADGSIVSARVDDALQKLPWGREGKGRERKGREGSTVASPPAKPRRAPAYTPGFESWWGAWRLKRGGVYVCHPVGSGPGSKSDAFTQWPGDEYLERVNRASLNYVRDCRATRTKTLHGVRFLKKWEEWENEDPRNQPPPTGSSAVDRFVEGLMEDHHGDQENDQAASGDLSGEIADCLPHESAGGDPGHLDREDDGLLGTGSQGGR